MGWAASEQLEALTKVSYFDLPLVSVESALTHMEHPQIVALIYMELCTCPFPLEGLCMCYMAIDCQLPLRLTCEGQQDQQGAVRRELWTQDSDVLGLTWGVSGLLTQSQAGVE